MRLLWILTAFICLSFAGGSHGDKHESKIKLGIEEARELGIRIETVRKSPAGKVIRMPAEVRENPQLSYRIFSPVEGIVKNLYVKEGDKVKKGQIVAKIYSPEIANLVSEIKIAKVRMETAKKLYERDKMLYEEGIIQYTRFFNSMIEFERNRGIYEALKEKLKSYGEVQDYHLILRSPGRGYVISQRVVVGDSVSVNRLMFEIHSHEILWVYGWADEKSARHIRKGMRGIILSDAGSELCRIDFIGHEVDEKTRRVKIRCVAKNRDHRLKPGMFVKLEVRTGGKKAIVIPKSAVQEIEGRPTVFVWEEDHFEAREVHIKGVLDGYYVVEGLREGEKIAVSGTVFLKTKLVGVEEAGHAH